MSFLDGDPGAQVTPRTKDSVDEGGSDASWQACTHGEHANGCTGRHQQHATHHLTLSAGGCGHAAGRAAASGMGSGSSRTEPAIRTWHSLDVAVRHVRAVPGLSDGRRLLRARQPNERLPSCSPWTAQDSFGYDAPGRPTCTSTVSAAGTQTPVRPTIRASSFPRRYSRRAVRRLPVRWIRRAWEGADSRKPIFAPARLRRTTSIGAQPSKNAITSASDAE